MSETNNNVWENLLPNIETDYFSDWLALENLLGEFGEPGFENITRTMKWPTIEGGSPLPLVFTCYRGDDGLLLGVFANYMLDGLSKPFVFAVHPDHQRQGIGTLLADHVVNEFKETHGKEFTYKESWGDANTTESAANWANKYVPSALEKMDTTER